MPSLAAQVPGMRSVEGLLGVEDPRAFVHGGRPHLLVTFHQMQPQRKTWAREHQVLPPAARLPLLVLVLPRCWHCCWHYETPPLRRVHHSCACHVPPAAVV